MLNKDAGHALLKERGIEWRIRNWTAKHPDVEFVKCSENLNFSIKDALYTPSRFCFQLRSDLVIRVYCVLAGCQHPTDCLFQGLQRQDKLLFFILGISMIMIFMITLTLIWFLVMTMRMVLRGQYIWDRLSVLLTNQSVVGQPCPHPLPVLLSSCHHHTIVIVIIILSLSFSSSSYFCGIRGVSQK